MDSEKVYTLKHFAVNSNIGNEYPLLVGKSTISLVPIELNGGSKQDTISFFSKPVKINVDIEEEIALTNEDAKPMIVEGVDGWGTIQDYKTNTAYISNGKIPLLYDISNEEFLDGVQWNEFTIYYDEEDYHLAIKNYVTGETINLKDGQHVITEHISQYVNLDYQIEFILERVTMDDGSTIKLPIFTMKGEPLK